MTDKAAIFDVMFMKQSQITNLKESASGLVVVENKPAPPPVASRFDIDLDREMNITQNRQQQKPLVAQCPPIREKSKKEHREETETVKKEKEKVITSVAMFIVNAEQNAKKEKVDYRKVGSEIDEIGKQLRDTATLASKFDRNAKTWSKVANFGQGLSKFAAGLQSIQTAQSFSLNFCLGYWGSALGALSMLMSVLNEDDESEEQDFRQELFSSLEQIYATMQRGFQRVESILIDCVCERLAHISQKLVRIETIMCASFRDLHRKDLLDIADAIRKDIRGEFVQGKKDRKSVV